MEPIKYFAAFAPSARDTSLTVLTPAGLQLSYPLLAPRGDKVLDALFLYPATGRPEAWALIDPPTGALGQFTSCKLEDLLDADFCPLGEHLDLTAPGESGEDTVRKLGTIFQRLRGFAFSATPDSVQQEDLNAYRELFLQLVPTAHLPFYHALSPAFCTWIGLPVPLGAPAVESAPPPRAEGNDLVVLRTLQHLVKQFDEKVRVDAHKQQLFDEMHAELQQFRNGLMDSLTRPMEEDIIKLIDDIGKTMELFRTRTFTQDNYRRLFSLFEGVRTDLSDLLYRHGVEPYTEEGDQVVIGRQKILATEATTRQKQDKRIARRLSEGWEKNGKVIRPERVCVYVYRTEETKSE